MPLPDVGNDPKFWRRAALVYARDHGDGAALLADPADLLQYALETWDPFTEEESDPDGPDVIVDGGASPAELAHLRRTIREMRQARIVRGKRPDVPRYSPSVVRRPALPMWAASPLRSDAKHIEAAQAYADEAPGRKWVKDNLILDIEADEPRAVVIVEPGDDMPEPHTNLPVVALDYRGERVRAKVIPTLKQLADRAPVPPPPAKDEQAISPEQVANLLLLAFQTGQAKGLEAKAAAPIEVNIPATTVNVQMLS